MRTLFYSRRKIVFIPLILLAVTAFSAVTMVLWNNLMPPIFQLPLITFWQALGLLILARLFFGGFRPHKHWPGQYMNHELRRKIIKMTPEEREEFFKKMRSDREAWHRECYGKRDAGVNDETAGTEE